MSALSETITQLNDIELSARAAVAALRDEREGDFTELVNHLHSLTSELDTLVRNW